MDCRKRIMIYGCVITLVVSSVVGAKAQDQTEIDRLTRRVQLFFANLADPVVTAENAFGELLAEGPLDDAQSKQLVGLLEEYGKLEGRYGKYLQAEQIETRRVSADVVMLTFLYKAERFPVIWRFVYYRPPNNTLEQTNWFIVRVSFDTRLEEL